MVLITITLKDNEILYFISNSIFNFIEDKSKQLTTIYNNIQTINYKKVTTTELNKYYHKIRQGF